MRRQPHGTEAGAQALVVGQRVDAQAQAEAELAARWLILTR